MDTTAFRSAVLSCAVLVLMLHAPSFALACSCRRVRDHDEAVAQSAVAFRGEVMSIETRDGTEHVEFAVRSRFKDVPRTTRSITVRRPFDALMCSHERFEVGALYFVYAERINGELVLGFCNPTSSRRAHVPCALLALERMLSRLPASGAATP